jgi:hypothetical protein
MRVRVTAPPKKDVKAIGGQHTNFRDRFDRLCSREFGTRGTPAQHLITLEQLMITLEQLTRPEYSAGDFVGAAD